MASSVSRVPAASSEQALQHFNELLKFETDCWDVHHAISNHRQDFVMFDVRSSESYQQGHIEAATCLPHARIIEQIWSNIRVAHCSSCIAPARIATRPRKLRSALPYWGVWLKK